MAYTIKQLTMAWTAVHDGVAPTGSVLADLENRAAQNAAGAITDAQALGYVLNSADGSTALAALSYQFFTGKSPTKDGLAYLVNSEANTSDLNDAYYAKFGLENRYINFAANLGVVGEGAATFATKYGAMSFADYIASIYETIIGSTFAKAAGLDPAKAIADIASRQAAILATAQSSGMIHEGMTQAQIDLAVKAAAAGYLMGEAIKADVGIYAGAANNFMLALAEGKAVYNTDITTTYKPSPTQGIGQPVTTAPPADTMPGVVIPPPPPPPPAPQPLSFTLTTGANTFTGENLNDTFTATPQTFNATDVLDGKGGNDTLTISGSFNGNYTPAAATFSNIETVNITNTLSGVYVDASGWAGVTKLNVTDKESTQVTASSTTDVTVTNTDQGGYTLTLNGGHDVSYKISNNTGGTIGIGQTTAATGAVVLERSISANGGAINLVGGMSIDVTLQATNAVNTTVSTSAAILTGTALTTTVKVKGSATITADASTAGHGGDMFIIYDVNRASNSDAGTISSVEADGFSSLSFSGSSLSTLTASHGGNIGISSNGNNPSRAVTLDAMLSGIDGNVQDSGVYWTLNLTRGAEASAFNLYMTALKTLAISGDGDLTFTNATLTNLEEITVTGAGKFNAGDLSSLTHLTDLDAHAATGAITAQVDASVTVVSTGTGADTLTIDGATISKAIAAGAGDDTVIVTDASGGITAAISGGAGTHDVLRMSTAAAVAASAAGGALITGFEVLSIGALANGVIDADALGGVSWVKTSGDGTINGLVSGSTLELTDGGSLLTLGATGFAGANDSLNVLLSEPAPTTFRTYSDIDSSGIETLNLQVDQPDHVPSAFSYLEWRSGDLQTLNVTGSGNLDVLMSNRSNLTLVDASAFDGSISFYGASSATPVTILGSAHGENSFRMLGSGAVTYTGGDGEDTVTVARGAHQIDVGTGDDTVVFTSANTVAAYASITGLGDAGDRLGINLGGVTNGSATQITGYTDLASYADAASASTTGGSTPVAHWFELDGDAYVVVDFNDSATYTNGWGLVVKLTGMAGEFSGALNIVNGYIEF